MICFNKSEAFRCDKQTPCHNARKNVIGNITTHRDLILKNNFDPKLKKGCRQVNLAVKYIVPTVENTDNSNFPHTGVLYFYPLFPLSPKNINLDYPERHARYLASQNTL